MSDRHYTGEEADFVFFALPDYSIESIDDFIDGKQRAITRNATGERVEGDFVVLGAEVVSYLREIRAGAFAAYRAGNIDLMMAKLGQLEAQCNWRGLAFATKSIVADEYRFRLNQRERAQAPRALAYSGRSGEALFSSDLVARIAPSKSNIPRITADDRAELWGQFFNLLSDEELDPEWCGENDDCIAFNVNHPRDHTTTENNSNRDEPKRGTFKMSTFDKLLSEARTVKTTDGT